VELATTMEVKIRGLATNPALQLAQDSGIELLLDIATRLTSGTAGAQANSMYAQSGALTAAQELTIDLNGVKKDVYGDLISFTKIKGILLRNTATTASIIQIGGGTGLNGTNAFDTWVTSDTPGFAGSEAVYVRPGGIFLLWAPDATAYATTAGTEILTIKETSTLVGAYEIVIVGIA